MGIKSVILVRAPPHAFCEAIAIGNDDFVEDIHRRLKDRDVNGKIVTGGSMSVLKEPLPPYNTLLDGKKEPLSYENTYCIDVTTEK